MLGLIVGVTGIFSALASGLVTDRLVSRDVRHYGLVAGLPLGISTVALAAALFWPGLTGSLACMALYFFLSWASGPPWAACIQSLAGPTNRATASAISIIAMVVFGNGLGPFLIGVLSDGFASFGFTSGAAVRLALLAGALPSLAACYLFLLARRHIAAELLEG